MLKADTAPYLEICPRCGEGGFERLKTHSYCVNCNYDEGSSDELLAIPKWVYEALRVQREPVCFETKVANEDFDRQLECVG